MNQPESDRSIERLIKLAGERDLPSAEGAERARRAAQESWNRLLKQGAAPAPRRALKFVLGLAVAAGLATVAFHAWHRPNAVPVELVARIATLDGGAALREAGIETLARVAGSVRSGTVLMTSEGRVALTFGDSLSLRVDRHTRLRFDSREQVTLLEGALYVDSGGVNAVPALRIETPAGVVRHVGTQFQVRVAGDTTRVRVREGRVLLTRAAGEQSDIATGDELQVRGHDLQWERGLPTFGPDWEWAASVAPPLTIENRPLAEFLAWMVREHGWQLRYGDESLQQRTHDIRLHGSLDRLGSAAMLERVGLVTGVPLRARDGVLFVGGAEP
ncbi:MAG TPA: FecR family protein [Steroidobacteraceae bacterium]|nr:FecR family protein [Steroidobacteraceae bacterium]